MTTIKRKVWLYMEKHPDASIRELKFNFGDMNYNTLESHRLEFIRFQQSDVKNMKRIIKRMYVLIKAKMTPNKQLSNDDVELLLDAERIIVSGD